ncbi:zinc ABC transporter substrate-binding protein [Nocardiopsis kunsanensis]|uniref:Zinc ABC transporter substrate-binding protein n=1 Tax=Nocardiopsis kunsanensis TaxID=141693 RepID=A0A918XBA3_9ACTN|nr:zinc ABC transporter substrate-binding protein [Nocardiopsis kunsanensis]
MRTAALGAATLMTLTACGGQGTGANGVSPEDAQLTLVTGVYPLEWLATEIGGDRVSVSQLTEPGAEPHDLELTGRQIGEVSQADIAFYVTGLQPAVDEAVEQEASDNALDVSEVVDLLPAEETQGEHDHEDGDEHDHGPHDPHFWLDTERMDEAATALAERMSEVDPEGADSYEADAEQVSQTLSALNEEYEQGLDSCDQRDVVVGHTAFTYLTEAHGLEQVGLSGVDPESEPSPAQIAEISDIVDERGIDTVFTEPLMPDATTDTIAGETGAEVKVLDPLEGVTEDSPGDDYPSIMRGNLDALTDALGCS